MGLFDKLFGKKKEEEPHSNSAGQDRLQEAEILKE